MTLHSATVVTLILLGICGFSKCDIYLHNPRGSNNRLNERSANRKNGNRMFDSQNNNRGGYNVGDRDTSPAGNNKDAQYQMKYFQSGSDPASSPSELVLEWTNQHGCGTNEMDNPNKLNCQLVLQFMCCDEGKCDDNDLDGLRDGTALNSMQFSQGTVGAKDRRQADVNANVNRGRHEGWDFYNDCTQREANQGLFLADQKRRVNKAKNTRQNPGGTRRGLECPEERDYYPYWHPSPWNDIAVLTSNVSQCDYYKKESANTKPKGKCFEKENGEAKWWSRYNNPSECQKDGGSWKDVHNFLEKDTNLKTKGACEGAPDGVKRVWGIPRDGVKEECLVALPEVQCKAAPFSRSNHLGNTPDVTTAPNYTWILPHFPSGKDKQCVYRIRYNISTDDYIPFETDSTSNGNKSPIQKNPEVYIGVNQKLKLAINTAQTGRTFQDRSHVFHLTPRPKEAQGSRIVNLNVRGKRGNIVQCYPAVEYDFVPNELPVGKSDLVHLQWTGSNTHNNGFPGGDGQTGDDGQGKKGTDRSNLVEIPDHLSNYPLAFEASKLFKNSEVVWHSKNKQKMSAEDIAINVASSGYYTSKSNVQQKGKMSPLLDDAPASFEGALIKFTKKGVYSYMSTRNNNHSNRSQKGKIIVA